jgi:uncharacterized membrane protein YozB (DUF420 family)
MSLHRHAAAWAVITVLLVVVVVFAAIRLAVDVPHLLAGTLPDPSSFERRYVEHPVTSYLHIFPGVVYLLGAPLQLSRRFRSRHFGLHRRLGRVLLGCGLLSGVFAFVFGVPHAFGGAAQAAATVVFGAWFVVSLALAYAAIRRRDVAAHRRWMIRAFAVGLAVGTIRLWIGLFEATGLLSFHAGFGVGFWLAFLMHVGAAEVWLASTARPRQGS